jgi:hypothetical protein
VNTAITKVFWLNREGKPREHSLGGRHTTAYSRDWFRRSVEECQGILSLDERRTSQLQLVRIENATD